MSTTPARFLASLCEPLEPARPPFYVKGAQGGAPDGWYWRPQGAARPVFLGRNVLWAEKRILSELTNGHEQTAAAS